MCTNKGEIGYSFVEAFFSIHKDCAAFMFLFFPFWFTSALLLTRFVINTFYLKCHWFVWLVCITSLPRYVSFLGARGLLFGLDHGRSAGAKGGWIQLQETCIRSTVFVSNHCVSTLQILCLVLCVGHSVIVSSCMSAEADHLSSQG